MALLYDRCTTGDYFDKPFDTGRTELLTLAKILTQNANERRSISRTIWPILEPAQKQIFLRVDHYSWMAPT